MAGRATARAGHARLLAVLGLLAAAALVAGCSVVGTGTIVGVADQPKVSAAAIRVKPGNGSGRIDPVRPVVVTSTGGTLKHVVLVDNAGRRVPGKVTPDGRTWTSTAKELKFSTRYVVRATAVDAQGLPVRQISAFTTAVPRHYLHQWVLPENGWTVGVGMPIVVGFDQPVTNKARVERAMTVSTTPATLGSWYWVNSQQVHWRPREYWAPGTKVTVRLPLRNLDAGNGTWGVDDTVTRFTIGAAHVSTVDIAAHTLTVRDNGTVVRTIPVTTGKPGFDTRIGIKVIMSKQHWVVMDAATIDIPKNSPEYYRLKVQWPMRLTWSGEYLHAAPWSVAFQGKENVSHGCTGMSTADAAWLFGFSRVGDVVDYVNGSRPLEAWNGYTDWNMSWAEWQQGSALS